MNKLLRTIDSPEDIKKLDQDELIDLSKEVRRYLVRSISESGGHLGSNLGVVELTIALHYCFNSPVDKIIWDVGHQSYVHKLFTGRKEAFKTLRQHEGLSGFPKRCESPHDAFDTGHSSTSISAALGFACARDIKGEDNYVLSVIGDGSLSGGLAYEGLNNATNLGSNFIVILNDNQMSISKNVGAMSMYLDGIRTNEFYNDVKDDFQKVLRKIPRVGEDMIGAVRDVKDSIKQLFVPGMFFEEMGYTYLGPIDGHNIRQVIATFNQAKKVDGPVLIHLNTVKGKGYKFAEENPEKFHGIKPFDIKTGEIINQKLQTSYSKIFGETLIDIGKEDKRLVAITAAMPDGTGLTPFANTYPERFFDVGIAEQHAVTFSAGLACAGMKPFVALYSSFLQRAYDQVVHDVAMQNLNVVFCIDRAGLVGEDGETHQGVFDVSFLNHIPNMTILAPKDGDELRGMVHFCAGYNKGPIALRYPRGAADILESVDNKEIEYGKSERVYDGENIAIITVGGTYKEGLRVYDRLSEEGHQPTLVNARFIKPIDSEMIKDIYENHQYIFIVEENLITGGYGSEVIRYTNNYGLKGKTIIIGIDDEYINQGKKELLLREIGLDADGIYNKIMEVIR